ncbi:MAG: 6-phosphogluconolactonase, partial [Rhodobacteraceae bacterium]|nr:6-phosphogluconolactonase [Paracoccaceae bacterium]
MKFQSYPDRDMMMFALADQLASDLTMALRQNERASFSVPGGTTPGPVFDTLAGLALDWERVTVFANDERWVPEDHPRSNARLIRSRLLAGRAQAATFVPLYADTPDPEAAMERLATALSPHLPISVLLLGMGADMHTASLFPGADRLAEALAPDAPILLPMRAEAAGEPRVTLTARVLADAMAIHILITGADKKAALEQAATLPVEEAPIRALLA